MFLKLSFRRVCYDIRQVIVTSSLIVLEQYDFVLLWPLTNQIQCLQAGLFRCSLYWTGAVQFKYSNRSLLSAMLVKKQR